MFLLVCFCLRLHGPRVLFLILVYRALKGSEVRALTMHSVYKGYITGDPNERPIVWIPYFGGGGGGGGGLLASD